MTTPQCIPPFPLDTNRDRFGDWLSGFSDGEACFFLNCRRRRKASHSTDLGARFIINLRSDDESVLRLIQSYWQCGNVGWQNGTRADQTRYVRLQVYTWPELAGVVVPHFDRYPLRAKKVRDFLIWREAVLLGYRVASRPFQRRTGKGRGRGMFTKWLPDERASFEGLIAALVAGRQFQSSNGHLAPSQATVTV